MCVYKMDLTSFHLSPVQSLLDLRYTHLFLLTCFFVNSVDCIYVNSLFI